LRWGISNGGSRRKGGIGLQDIPFDLLRVSRLGQKTSVGLPKGGVTVLKTGEGVRKNGAGLQIFHPLDVLRRFR
jgi:hypothetical protein